MSDLKSGPSVNRSLQGEGSPEQWLAAITDLSEDAIVSESLTGEINSWNRGAERLFGYTSEEAIGKNVRMLAEPGQEKEFDLLLGRVLHGERIDHQEVFRRHKDGTRLFVSLSLSPVRDAQGKIIGVVKIARDITQRKITQESLDESQRALEELRRQQERSRAEVIASRRFREMIESAPDAILEVNEAGQILVANKTAEATFGYERSELVGLGVDSLVPIAYRHAHAAHRSSFARAGKTRPMGQGLNLTAVRKDGSEVPVEISLSPITTSTGVQTIAIIRDISERRRTEEQVRSLQENYMRELQARHEEAERLNRLKSEFLASVSHELRTPLHTIIGFAELLVEQAEGPLNATQLRFLEHIRRDSEHLLGLINDVLDLSGMEADGLTLHAEDLNLEQVIQQAVDGIAPYASARVVEVRRGEIPSAKVQADAGRLRQILNNLLSNGVKFTPAGGHVEVSAVLDGRFAEVCVRDTGVGISAEEQERIFEKFYQVGNASGGVREGTGLGLAICRQLVEMHGGTIYVASKPGEGSCFCFTLPLSTV